MPYTQPFRQSTNNPGIVTNAPTTDVVWSTGRNVRFKPGCVYKTLGKTLLTTVPNSLPIRAMFTFRAYDNVFRTIVCCDTKVYSYSEEFGTYSDITPSPAPDSESTDIWQFALVGGLPMLTNGVDGIWKWASLGSALQKMSIPKAKYMINSMHRLLLGSVTENGYNYPARARWSKSTKPEIFTIGKEGKGGRADFIKMTGDGIEALERIVGFSNYKNKVLVHTEQNIYAMDYYQSPYDYQSTIFAEGVGLVGARAVTKDKYGINYLTGQEDFYMITDIASPIGFPIRNSVFPNLNKDAIRTAFSFYKPDTKEIFNCVPVNSGSPNKAYIYNTELKNWSICDVDYTCHTYNFKQDISSWDNLTFGSWDEITDSQWDKLSENGVLPYSVVGDSSGNIFKLDDSANNNGEAIEAYIETGDMLFDNPVFSKNITEIFPSVKPQSADTQLLIQVGTRESLHQQIEWSNPMAYTIGVDEKADFLSNGKYVRLRFYTNQLDAEWILDGYYLNYTLGGLR